MISLGNMVKFNYHYSFFISVTFRFVSDKDADEILTWEEYSSIPADSLLVRYSDTKREDEFYNFIDRNKDGKLDRREILVSSLK